MNERAPIETTNLDRYGSPPLEWSRPRDMLVAGAKGEGTTYFLGTVGPDGHPHAAGVGAVWFEGDLYVVSGPETQKSRNLQTNPNCTISVKLTGIDMVFEGTAARVTDTPTLEQLVAIYRASGWPAEVKGDAFTAPYSAPSAGP